MLKTYFPDQEFKALLFDFDGTIADTMPGHLAAWNRALAVYNLSLSREQHLAWAGRPTRQMVQLINELHGSTIDAEQFLKEKEVHYFSSLHAVRAITPVVEIIKYYWKQIPMAVVSGSRHKVVDATLAHLNLASYFDAVVCADDYENGKPAPDCFLLGAKLLKVAPTDCLVFEDSPLGIESARNAQMACLKISEDHRLEAIRR